MDKEEVPLKGYVFLGLTLVAGMLTQYYFVMIAFFFAVWYGVKFLYQKQYRKTGKFVGTFAVSAVASIALYPTMLHHIFSTGRGVEARENFASSEGYFEKLKTMWKLLDSQLFTNLFILIFFVLFVLSMIYVIRKKTVNKQILGKIGVILLACIGYFLIVTKIAPYQIDRYLMPIYPLVYLVIVGAMLKLMGKVIPVKAAFVLCILGFGGLSAIHMVHSSIPYTYTKDAVVSPRLELAKEYSDSYAIYVGEEEDMYDYFHAVQVLKEYKGFYNIGNLNNVSEIRKNMECLEEESRIVLYINHEIDLGDVIFCMKELFPNAGFTGESLVHTDEEWNVYLIQKDIVR